MELSNVNDLEWKIYFKSFGGEQGGNLPTLGVSKDTIPIYSISIQNIAYNEDPIPPGYHANWAVWDFRQVGTSPPYDNYWILEHQPSDTVNILQQDVDPGNYIITMTAYGDGYNHDSIEPNEYPWGWEGIACSVDPIICQDWGGGSECDHLEYDNNVCEQSVFIDNTYCTGCYDNPNLCEEKDYFCNGVWAEIEFYDGATPITTINSDDWGDIGDVSYSHGGLTYWTDDEPTGGSVAEVSQTINICQDTCDPSGDVCCGQVGGGCYENVCSDCGLRVHDGSVVTIACVPETEQHAFKVRGSSGNTYSVVVVETDDPMASNVRIQTSSGTKDLRKLS